MIEVSIDIRSKRYDSRSEPVLHALNIEIAAGEVVAVIGPSGAGKSTLLNIVAGLESCGDGRVLFDGVSHEQHSRFDIGYIFQQPRLMPWLTVSENIRLVAPELTKDQTRELLGQVGLDGKSDVYPKKLSGGMQRRVSIARAFSKKPGLLLLDEPFVSLDAPNAHRLRSTLESLIRTHQPTVLLVTHDLREAVRLADRILFFSSSPGMLIHEASVDIPKPRTEGGVAEQRWEHRLLERYPQILDGIDDAPSLTAIAGGFHE